MIKRLRSKVVVALGVSTLLVGVGAAEKTQQISWRSFQESAGKGPSISEQSKIVGIPTLYVIDKTGRIRNRWVGAPPEEALSSAIDRELAAVR